METSKGKRGEKGGICLGRYGPTGLGRFPSLSIYIIFSLQNRERKGRTASTALRGMGLWKKRAVQGQSTWGREEFERDLTFHPSLSLRSWGPWGARPATRGGGGLLRPSYGVGVALRPLGWPKRGESRGQARPERCLSPAWGMNSRSGPHTRLCGA